MVDFPIGEEVGQGLVSSWMGHVWGNTRITSQVGKLKNYPNMQRQASSGMLPWELHRWVKQFPQKLSLT